MTLACGLLAAALAAVAPASRAQEEQPRVVAVDIQGLRTIAKETCVAQLRTQPGMPYLEDVISEDIRRLFALGYFTDVRVQTEALEAGLQAVFVVREKPIVGELRLEGHRRLSTKRLLELIGVKAGELYDPRRLKDGIEKVKAEYHRKGYVQADIEQAVAMDEAANAATVTLVLDEGSRMRISRILIEGNRAFSDRRIRKLLKTKRRHWLSSGIYNEQVLDEDLERIRAFYRKNGYQDVQADKELLSDPRGGGLVVHMKITEGLQHRIGDVALTGAVLFPEPELRALLSLKPGSVYSVEALQNDLRAIKQYYGDQGYINAQVTPQTQLDPVTKRVNLTLRLAEHELAHVHRIDVRGNLRTKDVVIRRELRIHPGEAFNGKRIRRSIERLENLGYFEEVNVDTEPTSQPNQEDLIVDVKEAKTGSFSFGGGLSSVDRLVGLVELEQRNFDLANWPTFVGAGQDLRFRIEAGTVRRFFDISFTEPWIFGHPLSFGVDAYSRTRLRSRNLGLGFEEQQRGGGLRLGKEVSDIFRLDWSYQLFQTDISDIIEEASADLKAEQGRSTVSVGGMTATWDTRNNRFDPTQGHVLFGSTDVAGGAFAGDKEFYRLQGGGSAYVPHVNERLVLESRLRAGIVESYSSTADVPIFERFFAGGSNTIRGFQERRVGPRDTVSNDPIGGEAMLLGTVEEVMTVVKDERGKPILKGSVFYDVGNVWRRVSDFGSSVESGVGVGARVNTPIGPIRLDVGFPITRLDQEKRKPRLHFNISRSF